MKKLILIFLCVAVFCAFTPPGTIRTTNSTRYIDKSEISNGDWLQYMFYLKDWRQYDSAALKEVQPNPAIWSSVYHGNFKGLSIVGKTANDPIVGVSYAQVLDFCKWRSEVVRIKFGKKVIYRLPTPEEWLKYANQLQPVSKNNQQVMSDSLQQVSTPSASKKDVFHFADNISEMTSEKGIAMGNNYTDKEKGFSKHDYSGPESWLGFRCICEVPSK